MSWPPNLVRNLSELAPVLRTEIEHQRRPRVRNSRRQPSIYDWNREKSEAGGRRQVVSSSKATDTIEEERVWHGNRLTPERFLEHRLSNPGRSKGPTLL